MSGLGRCIGILREVKNKWERRVPLTPDHVQVLVQKGIQVLIQPSERRIFKDVEYQQSGAIITEDLTPASTIFGVKEFPESNLIPNRSYVIFSHVIKAQQENMPFLDSCLKKGIRLFDYECIRNNQGRLVAFGRYAGNAGMIDLFRGLGEKFLSMGFSTPFTAIPSAYMHTTLKDAVRNLNTVGSEIKRVGLSEKLSPLVFAFTGNGNVTKGALEIFHILPHEMLTVDEAIEMKREHETNPKMHSKVYGVHVKTSDLVKPIESEKLFSREHYYASPEQYEPILHKTLLPDTNVIVNGIYWDSRFPRILTTEQAKTLSNLYAIGDISCDINGSIQFLSRSTNIASPFFTFNPKENSYQDGVSKNGIAILAVDNLPAELPREASQHFSRALVNFAEELSTCNASDEFPESLSEPIRQSCIVSNGKLRPDFAYISSLRGSMKRSTPLIGGSNSATMTIDGHLFDSGLINKVLDLIESKNGHFKLQHLNVEPNLPRNKRKSHAVIEIVAQSDSELHAITAEIKEIAATTKAAEGVANVVSYKQGIDSLKDLKRAPGSARKKVLLLGSGFVAGPVVEILSKEAGVSLCIASDNKAQAEALASTASAAVDVFQVDGRDFDTMEKLIKDSSLVISLLPASLHVPVAKLCIQSKVNMLTASYVSSSMAELDSSARGQDIIILNECGLDPGLDHMSAMKAIQEIKRQSGEVIAFESFCGGLPSPEAADNPFGYKFSWSPRGALLAASNAARYKSKGEIVNIESNELLSFTQPLSLTPALNLEHYPNRNALPYAAEYGLQTSASTFYRGTIRYSGYAALLDKFKKAGFLNPSERADLGNRWLPFLQMTYSTHDVESAIGESFNDTRERDHFLNAMRWLGLFNDSTEISPHSKSVLDAFCGLLEDKLKFSPGERDLVILKHKFGVSNEGKRNIDEIMSTLALYGSAIGHSAMAQTVGIPVALAAILILNGAVANRGVLKPLTPDIYEPILSGCADRGIIFIEKSSSTN